MGICRWNQSMVSGYIKSRYKAVIPIVLANNIIFITDHDLLGTFIVISNKLLSLSWVASNLSLIRMQNLCF